MKKVNIYIPRRGYSIECILDSEEFSSHEIVVLGNYSKSNYNSTPIVSKYGVTPTVMDNHGQVTGVLEYI